MHRYFESRLQRALAMYALVPLFVLTLIGTLLMLASWRYSVVGVNDEVREQAAEKLAAVGDDFSRNAADSAQFLAAARDLTEWEDGDKRAEAFARLYGDVGHTGADFYVVDKTGEIILGSRRKLPADLTGVEEDWGIWQRLRREPFAVCEEFLSMEAGQDLLCGRAIVVDGEAVGYLLYDVPGSYLSSLTGDGKVALLFTDSLATVRLSQGGEKMLANRKVLADFAEADHELIHHGKDFYYVASTAVPFGGTEYRLYAISPVTDLLVRYIIGGVAILTTIAELRELESQFNPHFLFNTLENIKFMVRLDPAAATEMIMALSALLRYSIAGDGRQVALQEDVKYLHSYMKIQQYRFGSRLDFTADIDESALGRQVPKLLFQPLLENAIKYGEDEYGKLKILFQAKIREGCLNVLVKDEGRGIAAEKLQELQNLLASSANHSSHRGLFNVQRRLQLLYGESCGLQIGCPLDGGTEIRLSIPLQKKEQKDA